jgi:hypothetical protein
MNSNCNKELNEELKRKTSKIRLSYQRESNDQWKIGKCAECMEWFVVEDNSRKGHALCYSCKVYRQFHDKTPSEMMDECAWR